MGYDFYSNTSLGIEKVCPVCKKKFMLYDSDAHAFRIRKNDNVLSVCSWGCVRDYERKHEGVHAAKRRARIQKQLQGIREGY